MADLPWWVWTAGGIMLAIICTLVAVIYLAARAFVKTVEDIARNR